MEQKLEMLKRWIQESDNVVFFGGAGVSTESGIPDFRGKNGLYKQRREIPLEKILSHDFFMAHPEEFYRFVRSSEHHKGGENPNQAHLKLAELEKAGKLKAVITQNADGLHQKAGSKIVYELHGNANRYFCIKCGREYSQEEVMEGAEVPYCECGGLIRPGAVFFGESLDSKVLQASVQAIRKAEVLIVGGTSLAVYPAAGLIDYYEGDHLVLINEDPTPCDKRANLLIAEKLGKVFAYI